MFERLIQFLISMLMVASLGLHGIVHAAASGVPAAAAWHQRLDASADDNGPNLTGIGFDCFSRKQICHGDWLGLSEGQPIRLVQAASPSIVRAVPPASSWLPGVRQKPPRI